MRILSFLLISVVLVSCGNNEETKDEKSRKKDSSFVMPKSNGAHTETLVVMKDELWYGAPGDVLRALMEEPVYGLPQTEPEFKLLHVEPKSFNALLQRTKSVMVFEKSDTSFFDLQYNRWAQPQYVASFAFKSERDLMELMRKNLGKTILAYKDNDRHITEKNLKKGAYPTIPQSLKRMGIKSMIMPRSFDQTLDKPFIKIFLNKTVRTYQYLLIYEREIDPETLIGEDILAVRDSIGRQYFEGDRDGSYMTTETLLPPQQAQTEIDGKFTIEYRGLWKMVGDFMGGPFISYTVYDEDKDRIITIEALIYGPEAKKRNLMLEMEAMMKSIKFE